MTCQGTDHAPAWVTLYFDDDDGEENDEAYDEAARAFVSIVTGSDVVPPGWTITGATVAFPPDAIEPATVALTEHYKRAREHPDESAEVVG
jgi:hypothetical protein